MIIPRLFHITCKKQLIFLILLLSLPAFAQEVPGTVIFKPAPTKETQPNVQTPFRKPSIEEPKAPERPIIPKVNSPVVPGEDALKKEEEKVEEPNRRPLASQRRAVLPPEGMEPKDVVEQKKKTMPEGRKPLDLTESSPVVFAESDIAIYTWRPEEEYFEDDPTKTIFLKAAIKRAERMDGLQQAANTATLTIFPQTQLAVVPLANSFSAQDILFLDDAGIVRQMVYKTEPQSAKGVVSKEEVRSVLQMNSGSIKKYSIKIGDKVAIPPQ
jgi:uncharacterized membrane protein (UPF0127 family)